MLRALVEQAAHMALARRPPDPGLLHHADRGSQYSVPIYQELLARVRGRGEYEQLKRQLVQNRVSAWWLHPERVSRSDVTLLCASTDCEGTGARLLARSERWLRVGYGRGTLECVP